MPMTTAPCVPAAPAATAAPARGAACASSVPSAVLALLLAACAQGPQAAVAGGCQAGPGAQAALDGAARELRAQGLALQATCPGTGHAGWVVQVRVVDGVKASRVVRGPLADGEGVDMGTPAGVAHASARIGAGGYSPDVAFNRDWLRGVMARHQFANLPDAWWHFSPGAAPRDTARAQPAGSADIAAR